MPYTLPPPPCSSCSSLAWAEEMVDASSAQVWRRRGSSGFTPGSAPSCYVSLDKFLCLLYRILRVDLKELEGPVKPSLHQPPTKEP